MTDFPFYPYVTPEADGANTLWFGGALAREQPVVL